jgi:hypothetical protein
LGSVIVSPEAAGRALLERAGSRQPSDRGCIDRVGPRHISLRLARELGVHPGELERIAAVGGLALNYSTRDGGYWVSRRNLAPTADCALAALVLACRLLDRH